MNRREFLQNTAVGAAAITAGASWATRVLASPYNLPVGIELWTVRDQMDKDPRRTIEALGKIGYKEVEIVQPEDGVGDPPRIYGMTGKEFAKLLRDNGMRAPSGHYMLAATQKHWDWSIEQAHDMGLEYMTNAGLVAEDIRDGSLDAWKRLVDIFNKAAEPVQKAGMSYNYHNHNYEFVKLGDTTPYEFLTANLDPKIKFTLDCYWAVNAGQDPVELIKARPGRVPILHIKDMPKGVPRSLEYAQIKGQFVEIGTGIIDWKRIFKAAPVGGMKHYYYEQDVCDMPPLESAKISFDYLKNLTV
jgi:sugar phosphate isomerase/epimerase